MESKSVFIFVSLLPILFGTIILIAVIKNWGKGLTPKRFKYKIIRDVLGEKGTRIFGGIVGIGLILYGVFIFSKMYLGINPFPKNVKQSDNISIEKKTIIDANTTTTSTLYLTIPTLEQNIELSGESILLDYVKVSFRNNNMKSIPKIIWKMENLEEIDLTNNKITELPIENIKTLSKLKLIILTDNPIEMTEIERLQKEINIEIKY